MIFLVDSGASDHIATDRSMFSKFVGYKNPMWLKRVNSDHNLDLKILGIGTVFLIITKKQVYLNDVLFVPGAS